MKLKLARTAIGNKPKIIEIEKLEEDLEKRSIFYFDKDNSDKDIKGLIEYFTQKEFSVYAREIKFGLNQEDYLYEVHIVR
ncbi:MAG: hypothetical protein FNT15_01990 [Sulfurovum sp.]|jgi:hypothetical protein|nr:MAG: hypothetical protein FNT15_01990 [Sulfurovum sp.]